MAPRFLRVLLSALSVTLWAWQEGTKSEYSEEGIQGRKTGKVPRATIWIHLDWGISCNAKREDSINFSGKKGGHLPFLLGEPATVSMSLFWSQRTGFWKPGEVVSNPRSVIKYPCVFRQYANSPWSFTEHWKVSWRSIVQRPLPGCWYRCNNVHHSLTLHPWLFKSNDYAFMLLCVPRGASEKLPDTPWA